MSGTFTITFGGFTTSAIAFNAAPEVVAAQLSSLTSVGDVAVTRVAVANGFTWTVTFLTNTGGLPAMKVNTDNLGGGSAAAIVNVLVKGSGPLNAVYQWN